MIGSCLLIGTTRQERKWLGGIGGILVFIFIVGGQIIKIQSGFFEGRTTESAQQVGEWVVPWYIVLGFYLLVMINYRWIQVALKNVSWKRWLLISLDILFSLVYLWGGWIGLFVVAFTYFPFAP
ncbi:hypothetical protein [Oceanobacillus senegalensis]|uniref:hypothetical protein n=1 Tax=Oceanobacillus senegalensis TaxID=1936063 RepID=UPI001C5004F6|nr:hypothetical protein [Oceanobacillus senegalensis]